MANVSKSPSGAKASRTRATGKLDPPDAGNQVTDHAKNGINPGLLDRIGRWRFFCLLVVSASCVLNNQGFELSVKVPGGHQRSIEEEMHREDHKAACPACTGHPIDRSIDHRS